MHPMLSLTCRMAAAAAGALSVGVPTITARAADGTVDPAPARDTTTVTTTCTYGVIIVFATPFTANLLPCSQPLSAGRTAASTPAGSTSVGGMH